MSNQIIRHFQCVIGDLDEAARCLCVLSSYLNEYGLKIRPPLDPTEFRAQIDLKKWIDFIFHL